MHMGPPVRGQTTLDFLGPQASCDGVWVTLRAVSWTAGVQPLLLELASSYSQLLVFDICLISLQLQHVPSA